MAGDLQHAAWLGVKQQMRWAIAFTVCLSDKNSSCRHHFSISMWIFIVQFIWCLQRIRWQLGFVCFVFSLFTWLDLPWGFLSLLLSKFPNKWFEMHLSLPQLFSGQALERLLQLLISKEALASVSSVHRKKSESVLLGSSYLSSSWSIVCHVSIFDRPLCKLLFLCDSEIWAFPWLRMTSFSWKKLINGLFIPSCQKSWVFLLMERSCISNRTFFSLFLHSCFMYVLCVCVFIHLYTWWGNKNLSFPPY